MNSKVKVIFFDVGNTLLISQSRAYSRPARQSAASYPDGEHLRDLECRTKNQFDGMMTTNGSTDHGFWWMFYSQLLSEIGLEDDALRDQLVAAIRNSANWDIIRPGTVEQLR